jgi:hypothetical protein
LTIASIVRGLKKTYDEKKNKTILLEIKNLNLRLTLIRYMQLFWRVLFVPFGFAMLLLFIDLQVVSLYFFGLSLLSLLTSLGLSFWELAFL